MVQLMTVIFRPQFLINNVCAGYNSHPSTKSLKQRDNNRDEARSKLDGLSPPLLPRFRHLVRSESFGQSPDVVVRN